VRPTRRATLALPAAIAAGALPALAQSDAVDLALVVMVDVSPSIDETEYRLQREGYAAAFRHPRVHQAIRSGRQGRIAAFYAEWAEVNYQKTIVPWTRLASPAEAESFAAAILAGRRRGATESTSISGAVDFAAGRFRLGGFTSGRRVIDISGDGVNNNGRDPRYARDDAVDTGLVINGLAITNEEPLLHLYYQDYVIGGGDAFVIRAETFDAFPRAVLAKLVREIASAGPKFSAG